MTGAPAGPALDPERPRRPPRRGGTSPPRPGCSPDTLGSNPRATAVARTPALDRRPAVLAEHNERCWSSHAPCGLRRRAAGRCSAGARGDRARGHPNARRAADDYVGPRSRRNRREGARIGLPRASARIRSRTRSSSRPFVPIPPRSCCWAERRARARVLLDDRESLSKGRGAPVNLGSCSPVLSSRRYADVATVVHCNASALTRTGTSR
jgi:hypothetical protein